MTEVIVKQLAAIAFLIDILVESGSMSHIQQAEKIVEAHKQSHKIFNRVKKITIFTAIRHNLSATEAQYIPPLSERENKGHGGQINQTQKVRDTQCLIKVTQTITKSFGPIKTPAAVINMAAAGKPRFLDPSCPISHKQTGLCC